MFTVVGCETLEIIKFVVVDATDSRPTWEFFGSEQARERWEMSYELLPLLVCRMSLNECVYYLKKNFERDVNIS